MDANKFKKEKKVKLASAPEEAEQSVVGIQTPENTGIDLDTSSDKFNSGELTDEEVQEQLKYFETIGIDKAKLRALLDTLLTNGEVLWEFKLLKKIPTVFRLRPAWVNDKLIEVLDGEGPKSLVAFQEYISKYNLAGSLYTYGGTKICIKNEQELENALQFIGTLPYVVKSALIKELALFDRIIAVCTSEIFMNSFLELQEAK